MRPNGKCYATSQRKDLVKELNRQISKNEAVHEVVCVVEPGTKCIKGMGLQICKAEDDDMDPDWAAHVKVCEGVARVKVCEGTAQIMN